jgi:diguanylate cyclase (GGDEF)-like protein
MGIAPDGAGRTPCGASAVPAWSFAGCGAITVAAYVVCPPAAKAILYLAIEVASIGAMALGAHRQPDPAKRRPWWAVVAAVGCFLGATILRMAVPGASPLAPPTDWLFVPDALVVPGYLLLGYGLLTFLERRCASRDEPARADALLVGLVAALATWAFLIAPRFADHVPSLPVLAAALFPMADVVLLVMVARLLMADGIRTAALWLFAAAVLFMFAGDLLYTLQIERLSPTSVTVTVIDVAFLMAFVTMSAAVLHPTMRTLAERQPVQVRKLGRLRTVGLAALLIAPMAVTTLVPAPALWNKIVRMIIGSLVVLTVTVRMVNNHNSRHRAEQAARHRATHDALTELPNRELLSDTLNRWYERAQADGSDISLLFLDLDRFKAINDRWGHAVGDELLIAVADRLSKVVREDDLLCRIGADEFVIALASPNHARLAESLADRILDLFAQPFVLTVTPLKVTASIGIAHSTDATDAQELINDADMAMYRVKDAGRNGYAGFAKPMRDVVRRHADLTQALNSALTDGELSVVYQPIIDLRDDHVTGFEALMRWSNPTLGTVSPMEFIPIAEDTGLIVHAGAWLMEEAATQLARWRRDRPKGAPTLHMSVNLSARQLRNSDIVHTVRGIVDRTGVPPSALWLELTESAMLEDADFSSTVLRELATSGITLCLDDFGTGYSSLTYLKQFPSGIVKIDRSFVSGIGTSADDETIVQTVITAAHQLGQRVVAEGVETAAQRDWLRDRGCDLVQGYLYGRPEPADTLTASVRDGHGGLPVG